MAPAEVAQAGRAIRKSLRRRRCRRRRRRRRVPPEPPPPVPPEPPPVWPEQVNAAPRLRLAVAAVVRLD